MTIEGNKDCNRCLEIKALCSEKKVAKTTTKTQNDAAPITPTSDFLDVSACTEKYSGTSGSRKRKATTPDKALLEDVLRDLDGILPRLTNAIRKGYDRSEEIPNSSPFRTAIPSSFEIMPMIFSAEECWLSNPSYKNYLNDLLHTYDKHHTKIYQRGKPNEPDPEANIVDVLSQLNKPHAAVTYYAINIKCDKAQLKIPERLSAVDPIFQQDSICTTTNITPKYTFVDLHIGK